MSYSKRNATEWSTLTGIVLADVSHAAIFVAVLVSEFSVYNSITVLWLEGDTVLIAIVIVRLIAEPRVVHLTP